MDDVERGGDVDGPLFDEVAFLSLSLSVCVCVQIVQIKHSFFNKNKGLSPCQCVC